MKKHIIALIILASSFSIVQAKFGVGAGGGLVYPGFSKSSLYGSQFDLGAGFDIFLRHTLLQFSDSLSINARYSYRNYKSDINLPNTATTRFSFSYLGLGVFMTVFSISDFDMYAGGGASLVTVQAAKDFLDVTETLFMPEITAGVEWNISPSYNLFSQIDFQFGSIAVRDDVVYMNGMRVIIGGTMFLTE